MKLWKDFNGFETSRNFTSFMIRQNLQQKWVEYSRLGTSSADDAMKWCGRTLKKQIFYVITCHIVSEIPLWLGKAKYINGISLVLGFCLIGTSINPKIIKKTIEWAVIFRALWHAILGRILHANLTCSALGLNCK